MPHLATSNSPPSYNQNYPHNPEEDGTTNDRAKQIIHQLQRDSINSPSSSLLSINNNGNDNSANHHHYNNPSMNVTTETEERGDKNVDDNDEAATGGLLSLANSAQIVNAIRNNQSNGVSSSSDNNRALSLTTTINNEISIAVAQPGPPQRGVSKSPTIERQQQHQQQASPSPAEGRKIVILESINDLNNSGNSNDSKIITPTPMDKSSLNNEFTNQQYEDEKLSTISTSTSNSRPSSSMSIRGMKPNHPGSYYGQHDMHGRPYYPNQGPPPHHHHPQAGQSTDENQLIRSTKSPVTTIRNRPQLYIQTDRLDEKEWKQAEDDENGQPPNASPAASTPSTYCSNLNEDGERPPNRPPSAPFPREVGGEADYGMRKRPNSASIEHQEQQHGHEHGERGGGYYPGYDHPHHCSSPYYGGPPGSRHPPYYSPPHGHRYPHPSQKYPPGGGHYPGMHQYPPHHAYPYPPPHHPHYYPSPPPHPRHSPASSPDPYYYHPHHPHSHHYPHHMYGHGHPPYHPPPPAPPSHSANTTPPRSHQRHALTHEQTPSSAKDEESKMILHQHGHSPHSRVVDEAAASTPPSTKKRRMISPIIVSSTTTTTTNTTATGMQSPSSPDNEFYHRMRDSGGGGGHAKQQQTQQNPPPSQQQQQQHSKQSNNNNIQQQATEINSVAQWQEVQIMNGGFAPSANRCIPLKSPVPSKFWGDVDKVKDSYVPDFHRLVNFPDYLPKNRPPPGDGMRCCVMCGKQRLCTASISKTNSSNSTPMKASKSIATPDNNNKQSPVSVASSTTHIIPRQNKGLCTSCDVTVWVVTSSGLEIKWCKGCKNFRPWAAFGDKGLATKCVRCRERQREKYAMQKDSLKKRNNNSNLNNNNSNINLLPTTTNRTMLQTDISNDNAIYSSRNELSRSFHKDNNKQYQQQSSEMDAAHGLSNLLVAAVQSDGTTAV